MDLRYEAEVGGSIPPPGSKKEKLMKDLGEALRTAEERYYTFAMVAFALLGVVCGAFVGWCIWA